MSFKHLRNALITIGLIGLSLLPVAPAKAMGVPIDDPKLPLTESQRALLFVFSFGVLVGHVATRKEEEKSQK